MPKRFGEREQAWIICWSRIFSGSFQKTISALFLQRKTNKNANNLRFINFYIYFDNRSIVDFADFPDGII